MSTITGRTFALRTVALAGTVAFIAGGLTVAANTGSASQVGNAFPTVAAHDYMGTPDREAPEDSYLWNCWTMGNHDCGDALTVPGEGNTTGAILPKAADSGTATVAWSNGVVWGDAPKAWRERAWRQCVTEATGGDASMFACDEDWQYFGERFDMRTRTR